jgi:Ca2+-binding RTX toxin-like protein
LIVVGTNQADDVIVEQLGDILRPRVSIAGGSQIALDFNALVIDEVFFSGLEGNDRFENLSTLPVTAHGDDGNDLLIGGTNLDTLFGGVGDDRVAGQAGNDELLGQLGRDALYGDLGNDALHGNEDNDVLFGGAGDDMLEGASGADDLFGDDGQDALFGGLGDDNLTGDADNDSLNGGSGEDYLNGALGNDSLVGGDDSDYLVGGLGADQMSGGSASDTLSGEEDGSLSNNPADVFTDIEDEDVLQGALVESAPGVAGFGLGLTGGAPFGSIRFVANYIGSWSQAERAAIEKAFAD